MTDPFAQSACDDLNACIREIEQHGRKAAEIGPQFHTLKGFNWKAPSIVIPSSEPLENYAVVVERGSRPGTIDIGTIETGDEDNHLTVQIRLDHLMQALDLAREHGLLA